MSSSPDPEHAIVVPLEPMTRERFAPYGEVLGNEAMGDVRRILPTGFEHEGRVTLGVIVQPRRSLHFTRLERHFGVTQAFVQLSGAPSVVCVAPATDLSDPASVPDPHSIRGFLIDPGQGYFFHRGTWHSLDRFVLAPEGATFLIVNVDPNPTQIVDYDTGVVQMYSDLDVSSPRTLPPMPHSGLHFALPDCAFPGPDQS